MFSSFCYSLFDGEKGETNFCLARGMTLLGGGGGGGVPPMSF